MTPQGSPAMARSVSQKILFTATLMATFIVDGSCSSLGQSSGGGPPAPPQTTVPQVTGQQGPSAPQRLLLVNEQLSDRVWPLVRQLGGRKSYLIIQHFIDADHDGTPDMARLREGVSWIPVQEPVFACLDWETPVHEWLKQDPASPQFQQALATMIMVVREARRLRPNARWGYYGLPLRDYWTRDQKWRDRAAALAPLIAEVDAVYPSVYDFYRDGLDSTPERDHAYVRENVALALEIAGERPVLAYVMVRYHESNKKAANARIGAEELIAHVRAVFEAEYQGRRAAGVVWWGAETWHVGQGRLRDGMRPGETPRAYLDRIHQETARTLAVAVYGGAVPSPGSE
jgi:hypothetical protein